jgi:DnaJ-domain-containing protein 1
MKGSMEKAEYIRRLKHLIKQYHPDLCGDEHLKHRYMEKPQIIYRQWIQNDLEEKADAALTRRSSG